MLEEERYSAALTGDKKNGFTAVTECPDAVCPFGLSHSYPPAFLLTDISGREFTVMEECTNNIHHITAVQIHDWSQTDSNYKWILTFTEKTMFLPVQTI